MTRLNQLNASLERSVQKYDLAQVKLGRIQRDVRENSREGAVARRNLALSEREIARRLVALYTSTPDSTLEVILGARSLDDMLTRLAAARNVTSLDASVLTQVKTFRAAVRHSAEQLAAARAVQSRLVAQLAAQKGSIEAQVAEQNRLVGSLKGQIAHLLAVQAARQLALQRAAIARLQAQKTTLQIAQRQTVVGITAGTPDGQTVVPPSSYGGVVGVAMAQLGKPYVWAAAGPDSFDCSGLVVYSFAQLGVSLPHSSYALWNMGVAVSQDQLQPGDLVFFDGLGHVGIYIGGGSFVHAPHTGTVVQVSSLTSGWYAATYVGARRIL
jgi:peptidoglycan DL-endopeptidase CwlO